LNKVLATLLLVACSWSICAQPSEIFRFVALGDMPYSIPDDYPRYERLISAVNRANPKFSIFIGDTKSGSTPCSDEYNEKVKKYFSQFDSPLIYSIGDNEWTDCHRLLVGSYDPIERLDKLRASFFNTNHSFGKKQIQLTRQSDIDLRFKKYVENSYWIQNQFLFVNLHIPGLNNNFERNEQAISEYRERNQANLSWIQNAFSIAFQRGYKGIIFCYQADMFYSPKQATDTDSGYRDTLLLLTSLSEEYKKPVLLIHGDSHRLMIDQPLKKADQKHILENVLRLQVMGAEQVQAVEITVNPKADQPFSFTPILLRANMQ
jgi:hypothetical protein